MRIALCGCGAVGSWLALFVASHEHSFVLIDDDVVSESNIETSAFYRSNVGAPKSIALAELMWRKSLCPCTPITYTLAPSNRKNILADCDIVLDCFDNVESRLLTRTENTLHVGVSSQMTGGVIWDAQYTMLSGPDRGAEDTFCTHLAGKTIIRHTASVAAIYVDTYMRSGDRLPTCITTIKGGLLA